jgi:hypothetical protein
MAAMERLSACDVGLREAEQKRGLRLTDKDVATTRASRLRTAVEFLALSGLDFEAKELRLGLPAGQLDERGCR